MPRLVPGSFYKQKPLYGAVLREAGSSVWKCDHWHDSSEKARECADAELKRRREARDG